MKINRAKWQQTIIFFDIRNFSEHRSRLAEIKHASLLTNFVQDILNNAVELVEAWQKEFKTNLNPILNHTGDGFVLILRGEKNPLLGFLWMSEFREQVALKIKVYEKRIDELFPKNPPKKLGFGIGAHYGLAVPFRFKNFGNTADREGFIGSALNIASRVEQCTKDHVQNVLFTGALLNKVLKIIPKAHQYKFGSFWIPLGRHRLRGFEKPYFLFGLKLRFHQAWKAAAIVFPTHFA